MCHSLLPASLLTITAPHSPSLTLLRTQGSSAPDTGLFSQLLKHTEFFSSPRALAGAVLPAWTLFTLLIVGGAPPCPSVISPEAFLEQHVNLSLTSTPTSHLSCCNNCHVSQRFAVSLYFWCWWCCRFVSLVERKLREAGLLCLVGRHTTLLPETVPATYKELGKYLLNEKN